MSTPSVPAPHLAEVKPLTFVDHVVNIYHLVIKELRSIRADPVMLVLLIYSFSFSVNTVATGAVTEATNLSVGIVDEDGSDLSRRIAEGLRRPTFQPPVQINVDATAVAQAGNGASYLRTAVANEIQRFISGREDSTGAPINLVVRAA